MPTGPRRRVAEDEMRLAGALSPLRSEAGAWRSPWRRMRIAFSGALRPAAAAASGLTLPLLPPVADLELGSPRELRLNGDRFAAGAQSRRPSFAFAGAFQTLV